MKSSTWWCNYFITFHQRTHHRTIFICCATCNTWFYCTAIFRQYIFQYCAVLFIVVWAITPHARTEISNIYCVCEKSNMSLGKFSSKVENIDTWDLHICTCYTNSIERIPNYLTTTTIPWERLNKKVPSYRYMKSQYKDKMVSRPPIFIIWIPISGDVFLLKRRSTGRYCW